MYLSRECGDTRGSLFSLRVMWSPTEPKVCAVPDAFTSTQVSRFKIWSHFHKKFVKFDAYSCLRRLAWFVFQARCTSTAYQLVRERRPLPSCSSCVRHVYVLNAGCLAAGEDPKEPWSRFTAFWDDYPAKSFSRIRTSLSAFNTTPGTRRNAIRG